MSWDKDHWKPNRKQEEFLAIPISIKEAFYGGGAGSGKALKIDTIVPCKTGYKKIEDIHPGDFVYNRFGQEVLVIAESEIFMGDCYMVNFDCGDGVICDSNHEWIVKRNQSRRRESRSRKIITTKNIYNSSYYKYSVDVSDPINKNSEDAIIDPYTLGVWLGDGNSYDSKFTSVDIEIVNRVGKEYNVVKYNYGYSYRIYEFTKLLNKLNLIQNKHIPDSYFNLSFECRLALLQGLMDTDGTINASGSGIELSLSDKRLAFDSIKLIKSLGIKASHTINASSFNGERYKDRVRIKFATDIPVFSLRRKASRHEGRKTGHNSTRTKSHYILSVDKVEDSPVKCIQVEGGVYLCTYSCIPTHNSDILLVYGIANKWHENPSFKQVFMRRTYPDLKKEILGRSREIYSRFGATFNKTDMVWTFPRLDQYGAGIVGNAGAQIFLGHCEEEKDVHNYDSMEISLFTPDELTNSTEYIYLYIAFERNRSPVGSGLPSITRAAGMPGGIGHTFVKKRFVDPYPKGGKIIVGRGGNKRIYIHATLDDNKDNIDPTYAQSLDGRPEAERKAKKFGDWSAYLGQVFDEFRDKHYSDEPDNALHVIEPFEIPSWWPKFVIGDWGFAAMTYIGFYAVSPTKKVYQYRELYWLKTRIEEWAPIVKDYIDREEPKIVKFCKSAGQDRGQEHTIQQQIEDALERPIELSYNSAGSRVAGKMLLHEYLRWKPKPKIPGNEVPNYSEERAQWIFRNRGIEEYKAYLSIFDPPEEETNIPKFQIFKCSEDNHDGHPNCCPIVIDSIKACSYDNKTKDGKAVEDVAEFEGDDPYDTTRYAVDTAERYFEEASEEFKKVQREAAIIEKLNASQDWTGFYRNMRTLEAGDRVEGVSRFHRGRR